MRRITARSVSVWVALAEGANVTLSIWDKVIATGPGTGVFVPADVALHTASRHTVRIGNKLHIALVTIDLPPAPAAPLFPGKLYSYNLSFNPASGNADLKSKGLLLDKFPSASDPIPNLALGYMPGFLPSFVLPPLTIDKLNLVHGSCRKMHGPGKDTLAVLDNLIRKAVNDNDPDKRPHQLYLTGDQIYADEIPTVLMPAINALGRELLGVTENLTAKKHDATLGTYEASLTMFPATRRQRIVNQNAKFTTGEGANHLLSLGEFAATYLMGWNNAIWPTELYAADSVLKAKIDFFATWDTDPLTAVELELTPLDADEQKKYTNETAQQKADRIAGIKKHVQDQYKADLREVLIFRAQLPKVRRVLANVPVYMIMDDHEVTDDWYITKDWRDKVLTAPLGVNILRNALMAYTLFQDWGNDPATYAAGNKANLLTQLPLIFPAAGSGPATPPADAIDVLFGFNLIDETPPPVLWHYSVPASETTTYVLDTRTRRSYETRYSPPGLLSKSAMDDQIPLNALAEKFLIFVSPAPVLGLGLIEELLQPTVTVFSQYGADPEPWAFSPAVFEEFLQRLQKFRRVLFLSGDIHFGLAATLDYWKKGEAKPTRFIQYVSSGLKNQKFNNEKFLMSGFVQNLLGNLFYPAERLGWAQRAGLQVTNPGGKANQPSGRLRLRREPVLLPTHGWPAGSTVNQVPEWSWRMTLVADQRLDDGSAGARPASIQVHSITPDINPTTGDASAQYRKVLGRQVEIFKKSVGRRVEWDNNIGIIKFTTDGAGLISASQQLWYWLPGDELDDNPDAYTVYTDPLEPTSDTPPSIT